MIWSSSGWCRRSICSITNRLNLSIRMLGWTNFVISMRSDTGIRWATVIRLAYRTMLWYTNLLFNIRCSWKKNVSRLKKIRTIHQEKLPLCKGYLRLCPCGFSPTLSPTVAYRSELVSNWFGSEIGISGKLRCGTFSDLFRLKIQNWYLLTFCGMTKSIKANLFESVISLVDILTSVSPIEMVWLPFRRFSSGFLILTIPSRPSSSLLKRNNWKPFEMLIVYNNRG